MFYQTLKGYFIFSSKCWDFIRPIHMIKYKINSKLVSSAILSSIQSNIYQQVYNVFL